jgi:methylmalonyl-CoA mutase
MATVEKSSVLGITGTGGAGKSSIIDELVCRFLKDFEDKTIGILSVDPSRKRTGGALLGDRIRMNHVNSPRIYMRSFSTRGSLTELSPVIKDAIDVLNASGYDLIIVETGGIGQGNIGIVDIADVSIYVMTPDFGAPTQLEKIDMLDFADIVTLNKSDRRGSHDALRHVRKQFCINKKHINIPEEKIPVFSTCASHFNDPGVNVLFKEMIECLNIKKKLNWSIPEKIETKEIFAKSIIPPQKVHYLGEIVNTVRDYNKAVINHSEIARKMFQIKGTIDILNKSKKNAESPRTDETPGHEDSCAQKEDLKRIISQLEITAEELEKKLSPDSQKILKDWEEFKNIYKKDSIVTKTRGKELHTKLWTTSLSGTKIPKICLPEFKDWGEIVKWCLKENLPGFFPYTAGVFPFKRIEEEPKRQFAGEGPPERTNLRFHHLCKDEKAKRLSTAFDSITLYGEDPDYRPDIYGKIGEGGVSICTLEDMKKLYSGFDLCDANTSVSMTINGPAPIILAMFFNTAIDQQVEKFRQEHKREPDDAEYKKIKTHTLKTVRGTVQADILKEDQGQNTCIFATEFALRMMGDIQQYFIEHEVRNYYSVSISGYHIAEAGANPISQLAFTLANGFTFVEYYLSRGMHIDEFAHNLSFFFSNGLDPEYSVIGRVARRIWAIAMKEKYKANERSQKLKYHIQTSGRSLHAQEMTFNDIRTTLQALMAIYDNCNSLHTNAYDEAITTPTEDSVRQAMAIQLIINREFGLAKNENPMQGSYIIELLTDLVEEAILQEFEQIDLRGGVFGAMENQYQRSKIQDESLLYEMKKHSGELPIIGVNTFLNPALLEEGYKIPKTLSRSTKEEKEQQIRNLKEFQKRNENQTPAALKKLQQVAKSGGNIFAELMETVKYASLGQITNALYEIGGKYRRNI